MKARILSGIRRIAVDIIALVLLAPAAVFAQHAKVAESLQGPPSPTGLTAPQIVLEVGQGKSEGEIAISAGRLTLKASAPVDEDTEQSEFTSLDGLADKISFAANIQDILKAGERPRAERDELRGRVCERAGLALEKCPRSGGEFEDSLKSAGIEGHRLRQLLADWDRASFTSVTWVWSAEFESGYKKYEYFETNAVEHSSERFSNSLKAALTAVYTSGAVILGATFESATKAGKTKVRSCESVAVGSPLTKCKELSLGEPVRAENLIPRVEVRHRFAKFAVAPLLSYAIKEEVLGIELPIYVLRGADGIFTGGIRGGWRSDEKDLKISFFLSKPLSTF